MLFDDIAAILESYPNGVLTIIDEAGYPLSVRCQPRADQPQQRFYVRLPDNLPIQAGAASLLFHAHDEQLDNLRSVTVQGTLAKQEGQWLFQPEQIISGLGRSKFFEVIQDTLLTPRRNTKRYLQKHKLPRPIIPWDKLRKIVSEISDH
ncbi:MAG: hypothetical protein K8L97_30480 [Anaerolineae bacterium]|nr:hypothetical protein [Anaerolineae bacterium]